MCMAPLHNEYLRCDVGKCASAVVSSRSFSSATAEISGVKRAQMLHFQTQEKNTPLHAAVNGGDLEVGS